MQACGRIPRRHGDRRGGSDAPATSSLAWAGRERKGGSFSHLSPPSSRPQETSQEVCGLDVPSPSWTEALARARVRLPFQHPNRLGSCPAPPTEGRVPERDVRRSDSLEAQVRKDREGQPQTMCLQTTQLPVHRKALSKGQKVFGKLSF